MLKHHLKCNCGATAWHPGWEEFDTNAVGINEDIPVKWNGGSPTCEHEDYEIVESEYVDPF